MPGMVSSFHSPSIQKPTLADYIFRLLSLQDAGQVWLMEDTGRKLESRRKAEVIVFFSLPFFSGQSLSSASRALVLKGLPTVILFPLVPGLRSHCLLPVLSSWQ